MQISWTYHLQAVVFLESTILELQPAFRHMRHNFWRTWQLLQGLLQDPWLLQYWQHQPPYTSVLTMWLTLTHDARRHPLGPFNPQFDLVGNLRRGLELHLPSNSNRVCSGRLFVSVTSLKDRKNVIISEFDSKEELIQVGTKLFIAPKFLLKNNFQLSVVNQIKPFT